MRWLLKGKQIIVNGVPEWNGIYVAARRKGVQALRFMIGANQFAVVAEGRFGGRFKFIEAGNIYYAREDELGPLCRLAEKAGISLDCRLMHKTVQSKVFRVGSASMFKTSAITLDFKCVDRPRTKADFTYQISPNTIEILDTGRGNLSVGDDLDAVMRRIEYWHMGSVSGFKITYRDANGVRHEVQWDGRRVLVSPAKQAGPQS